MSSSSDDADDEDEIPPLYIPKKRTGSSVETPQKSSKRHGPTSPKTPLSASLYNIESKKTCTEVEHSIDSLLEGKHAEIACDSRKQSIKEMQELDEIPEDSQSQEYDFHMPTEDQLHEKIGDENMSKWKEINQYESHDFRDDFPGLEIFTKPVKLIDEDLNCRVIAASMLEGESIPKLRKSDQLDIICSVLPNLQSFSTEVKQCVLNLILSSDFEISHAAYSQLHLLILSLVGCSTLVLLPGVTDLLHVVRSLGGNHVLLTADQSYMEENEDNNESNESEDRSNFSSDMNENIHSIKNTLLLVKLSLLNFSHCYKSDDLVEFLTMLLLLTCERKILELTSCISNLIAVILDVFEENNWTAEVNKVLQSILRKEIHHHNLLRIVQCIPMTQRGCRMRQLTAYVFVRHILSMSVPIITSFKVENMIPLFNQLTIDENTDYYKLHSCFSLMDKIITNELATAKQKSSLDQILRRLKKVQASVREGKGMFLNRTKLKDLLHNMICRISFLTQSMMRQTHLDSYFGATEKLLVDVLH